MLCFCHSQIQIRAAAGSERKRLAVNLKPGALVASDRPLIPGANDEIQWFAAGTFPGNNIRHLKDLSPVMHSAVLRIYADADKKFIILLPEANITNEKISVPKNQDNPAPHGDYKTLFVRLSVFRRTGDYRFHRVRYISSRRSGVCHHLLTGEKSVLPLRVLQ